jgi:hypothetical protein
VRLAQIAVAAIAVALVVKFGFGAAVLLLLFLAAIYMVGAIALPIIVRATLRIAEKPPVQAVAPDDASIPETVRATLRAHHDALVSIGFEPRGVIHQPAASTSAAYLALYRQSATAARALSRVILKPGKGPAAVHSTDVEFEIRYDNGTSAELSNVGGVMPGIELVPGLVRQMPGVRDVPRLFDYFLKLVAKYERDTGLTERARVPLADVATLTDVYHEQLVKSHGIQHRAGLIEASRVPGVWRPTWRTALMIAAGSISPGAEFVKRRMQARGERLQRELDGYPTPVGGALTGWIMLAIGLALIVAAVVMAPPACSLAALGMVVAWSLAKRGGREPGWRAIVVGGVAAIVLLGIPIVLASNYPSVPPSLSKPDMLALLPMGMLVAGAALMVEGFRAAASSEP